MSPTTHNPIKILIFMFRQYSILSSFSEFLWN